MCQHASSLPDILFTRDAESGPEAVPGAGRDSVIAQPKASMQPDKAVAVAARWDCIRLGVHQNNSITHVVLPISIHFSNWHLLQFELGKGNWAQQAQHPRAQQQPLGRGSHRKEGGSEEEESNTTSTSEGQALKLPPSKSTPIYNIQDNGTRSCHLVTPVRVLTSRSLTPKWATTDGQS